jgi:TM2 domain-containing membrane protein YozV
MEDHKNDAPEAAGSPRPDAAVPPPTPTAAPPPYPEAPYARPPRDWGREITSAFDPRAKSPVLACFLSLMPGLGQIYVGYYKRGFIHAAAFAGFIAAIAALSDRDFTPAQPMIGVMMTFFYLYNLIDAGRRAALYNRALHGSADLPLPEEVEKVGLRGSILGGTVLIIAGIALLLHTRFDVSLDWIAEWWPIAPILFGVYLIVTRVRARQEEEQK